MTATVTPIRAFTDAPRYLAWVEYTAQPPAGARDAVRGWQVEQQLGRAWDEQTSPYSVLALFAPEVDARAALDALFDAADAVRSAELQEPGSLPLDVALDAHTDALAALVDVLRGAR